MTFLKRLLGILVAASIPVIISGLSLMLLLSPLFMNLEYRRPGFPPDHYGFSTQQRLEFGNITRRYLISSMTLDDLRELSFPEGDAIYLERELSHLEDVKVVLQGVQRVFYLAAAVFVLGLILAVSSKWERGLVQAIGIGGKGTAGLLVLLVFLTLVSFQAVFTNFHLIFFEGDSWLFDYSDTLIRLFPIRFWQDIFLVFGLTTLVGAFLLGWLVPAGYQKKMNKPGSQNDG
jgi:integral membrane protein (TIGR01906 family)